MNTANKIFKDSNGDSLTALLIGLDDIAETYEDDYIKEERIYHFADGSSLIMSGSDIKVSKIS